MPNSFIDERVKLIDNKNFTKVSGIAGQHVEFSIDKDAIKSFLRQSLELQHEHDKNVMIERMEIDPVWLAQCFHDYYEATAKTKGWKTQKDCQVNFEDLPEANKQTMICTASKVTHEIKGKIINSL